MRSRFSRLKKLSTTALSWQSPLRLMEWMRLWSLRNKAQSMLVNCEPWSLWIRTVFFGFRRHTAMSRACKTTSVVWRFSYVSDICHPDRVRCIHIKLTVECVIYDQWRLAAIFARAAFIANLSFLAINTWPLAKFFRQISPGWACSGNPENGI